MRVIETAIEAVKRIEPPRFSDPRGWFMETWSRQRLTEAGIEADFVQDNLSLSTAARTVRGLHYQRPPFAQAKLVRVSRGAILDVAVDARKGSRTFGMWVAEYLSAENGAQLWVPRGFLHGFITLEPMTEVAYKVDAPYASDCDGAVRFDDPDLGIDWGMDPVEAIVSAKDANAPWFRDFASPFDLTPSTP